MKKLILVLVCVSMCVISCKPKTTQQENQPQTNVEDEVSWTDLAICQSCGMPMTEDLYGTNADSTANKEYCKYCYVAGNFTNPDITMEDMIKTCVPYMVQQGMTEELARNLLEESLPKLKRWKTQE
jgi:hypothetical protein